MSEPSATMARTLAMPSHARHNRRGRRALLRDRVLRVLATNLGRRQRLHYFHFRLALLTKVNASRA